MRRVGFGGGSSLWRKSKRNQEQPKRLFALTKKSQPRRKDAIDEYEDGHDVYNDPAWKK